MTAPHKARIQGCKHMVAAGHYLAAQAAFQVLEAGGNAIDAGVAGGIALGVVQSEYVGFGGVAPIMVRLAETEEIVTISGLGHWPAATDIDQLRASGGIPRGILRTIVPAGPDAWITALERFGTISYEEAAGSALKFARDGFPVSSLTCAIVSDHAEEYAVWDSNAAIYLPEGKPPVPGARFVQSDLANTISYMIDRERAAAKEGRKAGLQAARDAFYKGDIAARMVAYHRENGGWLRETDLAEFHVELGRPITRNYAGIEVNTCGPWCQGPVLAMMLGLLEGSDLRALGHNSAAYIHHLTEAMKLAFADRHSYFGDPNFVDVPMQELLAKDYLAARRHLIDPERAAAGMPEPGKIAGHDRAQTPGYQPARPENAVDNIDTSYICVVDDKGNVFSATPSDGSSSAPVIPGLGFVPSSRGVQSWIEPNMPAVAGPLRRPRLTPSPAILSKPSEWVMPIGSPGNDVQPQAMLQVLLNIHLWGMTPQQAVEAPRFATFSFPRSSAPHSYDPGLLRLESRMPNDVADELRALGHDVKLWPDWEYAAGAVCTIVADHRSGMMEGGSDPRRPTAVLGW